MIREIRFLLWIAFLGHYIYIKLNNKEINNKAIGETTLWLNTFTQMLKIHSNLYEKLYKSLC